MKKLNKNGITLIALIITVIVLLILAGITINLTIGERGIITRAQETGKEMKEASAKEKLLLALGNLQIEKEMNSLYDKDEFVTNYLMKQNMKVEQNMVTVDDYQYQINRETLEIVWDMGNNINQIEINSKEELITFRENVNSGMTYEGKTIILTKDIDLLGDDQNQWTPIGTEANQFKGIFNGNNKTISNLYINKQEIGQGLFKYVGEGGEIANLNINGEIKTNAYAGSITAYNSGTINNCKSTVKITATFNHIGGIVGQNETMGNIKFCNNFAEVSSTLNTQLNNIGGIVGLNYGTVEYSVNKGKITGNNRRVGGISGFNEKGKIQYCYNLGEIIGTYGQGTAGISGGSYSNASISNSYNKGDIKGYYDVGGIVGYSYTDTILESVYNRRNITATGGSSTSSVMVGGIAGDINVRSNLNYAYNTGNVKAEIDGTSVSGIVGVVINNSVLTNVYNIALVQVNTVIATKEIVLENEVELPATIALLRSGCTCTEYGTQIELSKLGDAFEEDIYLINDGYPVLKWETSVNGIITRINTLVGMNMTEVSEEIEIIEKIYNALSESDKKLVTNYNQLLEIKSKI